MGVKTGFCIWIVLCLFLGMIIIGCEEPKLSQKIVEDGKNVQKETPQKEIEETDGNGTGSKDEDKATNDKQTGDEIVEKESVPKEEFFESGKKYDSKYTAAWAHSLAFTLAKEWEDDAKLFQIEGINIKEGKITDETYYVSDQKFYQSYFIVRYISESTGFKEILEVRVNWDGANKDTTKKYIPSNLVSDYDIEGWKYDIPFISDELNKINSGFGYFLKNVKISPLKYLNTEAIETEMNYEMNNGGTKENRVEIYSKLDDTNPIAMAEAHNGVIYEFDLNEGKMLGYYKKRS